MKVQVKWGKRRKRRDEWHTIKGIGPGTVPFHGAIFPSTACRGFGIVTAPWPEVCCSNDNRVHVPTSTGSSIILKEDVMSSQKKKKVVIGKQYGCKNMLSGGAHGLQVPVLTGGAVLLLAIFFGT